MCPPFFLWVKHSFLRKKVINSPDIRQVIGDVPYLESYANSLYNSNYSEFFQSLVGIMEGGFRNDKFLNRHSNYYLREVRTVAYKQFLQSYLSVKLESMAASFGVSPAFLDS